MTALSSLRNVCVRDLPNLAHSKTKVLWKGKNVGQLFIHTKHSPQKNRMGGFLREGLKEEISDALAVCAIGFSILGAAGGAAHGFYKEMTKQQTPFFSEKIVLGLGNALVEGSICCTTGFFIGLTAPVSIPALSYYYFNHSKQKTS